MYKRNLNILVTFFRLTHSLSEVFKLKALIPCGGKGTRLRPLTNTLAKPLIPVANKPILFYILEQVVEAGIYDIGIVISPEDQDLFQKILGDGAKWAAKISYITQEKRRGLADTVIQARNFLGNSPFLMFLGDNLVQGGIKEIVSEFITSNVDAMIQVKRVHDPRRFGVAILDDKNCVLELIEKPQKPPSDLAVMGIYLFRTAIHQAVLNIMPSLRGELEITDAIQRLVETNYRVEARIMSGWWLDTGKKEELLRANRIILEENVRRNIEGVVDEQSIISGQVEMGTSSKVIKSVIRGPVKIGNNVTIVNSFIGPNSSIGDGTVIQNTSMQYSIVMENCQLVNVDSIEDSLLGCNCIIQRPESRRKIVSFLLGDNSEIIL